MSSFEIHFLLKACISSSLKNNKKETNSFVTCSAVNSLQCAINFSFKKVNLSSNIHFHVMSQIMRGGITKPLIPLDFAKHHVIFCSYQTISWIERKTESIQGRTSTYNVTNKRSTHRCWGGRSKKAKACNNLGRFLNRHGEALKNRKGWGSSTRQQEEVRNLACELSACCAETEKRL